MVEQVNKPPIQYLPDIEKLKKADPDSLFFFERKEDVESLKDRGYEVVSDPKKESKKAEGQTPVDSSVGTWDLTLMKLSGAAKEKYLKERKEAQQIYKKAMIDRHEELEKTRQFRGRIDIK